MEPIDNAGIRQNGAGLPKTPTGINGLDELTGGGLPQGRPTLVCGGAGCGKTLFGLEFLVRGATHYQEPGVMVTFEETAEELIQNACSLGFDLAALTRANQLFIDYIYLERSEIEETGEYDLDGLFIRLEQAINTVKAKRVVLDTIEALFSGLSNEAILRAELRRLMRWLKDKGVTALITAERGEKGLTHHGLEEYISDCVILLDHRVSEQISTRRLRVVKYRGSAHGTNEYPFLLDADGFTVLPITSLGLSYGVSTKRVSSGMSQLDEMLGGQGYFQGSSVLVCGTAGTGKTSMAAHFADAAGRRGERCLYFAFEEATAQIIRNMRSIGLDLTQWQQQGLLCFHAGRPTNYGLEMHLALMHKLIQEFQPQIVIVDPITNFTSVGEEREVKAMLTRLIDFLKAQQITTLFTSLTGSERDLEMTEVDISSLMDTWLLLRDIELNGERNRGLYILKSRGMAHSNQIREFILTDHGIELMPAYLGLEGVLTGSARVAQQAQDEMKVLAAGQELERKKLELERKRRLINVQRAALEAELEAEEAEFKYTLAQAQQRQDQLTLKQVSLAHSRQVEVAPGEKPARKTDHHPKGGSKNGPQKGKN